MRFEELIKEYETLKFKIHRTIIKENEIRELENNLDRENGILVYDIEFKSGNNEYSYDINAQTGEIIDREKDLND